jgi:cytochrome c-type biogenesis protein CcmE
MKSRPKRLALVAMGLAILGVAAALILNAFQSNLVFFYTPSQVVAKEAPQARRFASAAWWSRARAAAGRRRDSAP